MSRANDRLNRQRDRGINPDDHRRALALLASCRDGCSELLLVAAHRFSVALLVELVTDGLATAVTERVLAGKKPVEVTRLRITAAGRRAATGERVQRG
jgi:hypothetical protein